MSVTGKFHRNKGNTFLFKLNIHTITTYRTCIALIMTSFTVHNLQNSLLCFLWNPRGNNCELPVEDANVVHTVWGEKSIV